jgi:hypothetical protein
MTDEAAVRRKLGAIRQSTGGRGDVSGYRIAQIWTGCEKSAMNRFCGEDEQDEELMKFRRLRMISRFRLSYQLFVTPI